MAPDINIISLMFKNNLLEIMLLSVNVMLCDLLDWFN